MAQEEILRNRTQNDENEVGQGDEGDQRIGVNAERRLMDSADKASEEAVTSITENAEQGVRNRNGGEHSGSGGQDVSQQGGMVQDAPISKVDERRRELPVTLARVLFLACDACIYCGGKFVG